MRILLLADLHGNMDAVRALEAQLPLLKADEIWFLGDAVGKGPDSPAAVDWVRAHCQHFIGGNWDYGVGCREFPNDAWYWDQLGEERLSWLASLPREAELELSDLRLRLFHGRPVTDLLQGWYEEERLAEPFTANGKTYDGVIFADSHRPFIRTLNKGYMINTGSVGNSMGVPRVHCLLLEGGDGLPFMPTMISIPYDNAAAVTRAMAEPGLPRRESWIREIITGIYSR